MADRFPIKGDHFPMNILKLAAAGILTAGFLVIFIQGTPVDRPPRKTPAQAEDELRQKSAKMMAEGWTDSLPQAEIQTVLTGTVLSSHARSDGLDIFMIRHGDALYQCEVHRESPHVWNSEEPFAAPLRGPSLRLPVCWKLSQERQPNPAKD